MRHTKPSNRNIDKSNAPSSSIVSRCSITHIKPMLRQPLDRRWQMVMLGLDLHLRRHPVGIQLGHINAVGQYGAMSLWRAAIDPSDPAIIQGVLDTASLFRNRMEHLEYTSALRVRWQGVEYRPALRICVLVDRRILKSLEKRFPAFQE